MKRKYPRSVRAAKRRGWAVVEPTKFNNVSYLGLMIWTDRNTTGKYVSSFEPTRFAFEQIADAAYFTLKWS
jgi:hypothetical protein